MRPGLLLAAALGGLSGVALGAFGAHGLRGDLAPGLLAVWETGVRYQLFHSLALLALALAPATGQYPAMRAAGWAWAAGMLVFSGSLYVLALTGVGWLGAVAPLGGLSLMAGWGLLAVFAWRRWREHTDDR